MREMLTSITYLVLFSSIWAVVHAQPRTVYLVDTHEYEYADTWTKTTRTLELEDLGRLASTWTADEHCYSASPVTGAESSFTFYTTFLDGSTSTSSIKSVISQSYYYYGCGGQRASCCPPGFRTRGFYQPFNMGYLQGFRIVHYQTLKRNGWITVTAMDPKMTGHIACPLLTTPNSFWGYHLSYTNAASYDFKTDLYCMFSSASTNLAQNGEPATTFYRLALAQPIFFLASSGTWPNPPPTDTGASDTPLDDEECPWGRFSKGAIAGIAVGISLPLLGVGIYLGYRFARRGAATALSPPLQQPPQYDGASDLSGGEFYGYSNAIPLTESVGWHGGVRSRGSQELQTESSNGHPADAVDSRSSLVK